MLNFKFDTFFGEDFEAAFIKIHDTGSEQAIIEYKNKRILILNLFDPTRKEIFKKCNLIKDHQNIDGAIIYSRCEVIDDELLDVFYFTCKLYKIDNVAIYDCRMNNHSEQYEFFYNDEPLVLPHIKGNVLRLIVRTTNNINQTGKYIEINQNMRKTSFFHEPKYYYVDVEPIIPEERTILYTCLNREPRKHRVMLVNELFKQGLKEKGVVSCGYLEADYPYNKFVDDKFQDLFPIELEDRSVYTNASINLDVCNRNFIDCQLQSFVNIVSESSCDWEIHNREGWKTTFFTEKSAKAFIAHNLPIFFNNYKFVEGLRGLGFDVFDDIIDHSYDDEINPFKKIEMIVAECKRLIELPRNDLIKLLYNLEDRFDRNIKNLLNYVNEIEIQKMKTMRTFFENA